MSYETIISDISFNDIIPFATITLNNSFPRQVKTNIFSGMAVLSKQLFIFYYEISFNGHV